MQISMNGLKDVCHQNIHSNRIFEMPRLVALNSCFLTWRRCSPIFRCFNSILNKHFLTLYVGVFGPRENCTLSILNELNVQVQIFVLIEIRWYQLLFVMLRVWHLWGYFVTFWIAGVHMVKEKMVKILLIMIFKWSCSNYLNIIWL